MRARWGTWPTWRLPLHVPVAVLFSLLILGVGTAISLYHFGETRHLLDAAQAALFRAVVAEVGRTVDDADRAVRRSFVLLAASSLADATRFGERVRDLPTLTGLLEADPVVDSVMIGYGGGDFLLVRHGRGEVAWEVVDVSRPAGVDAVPVVMVSRYDAHLRLLDARAEDNVSARYEPRLAEWYRLAAAQDALVVTAPGMLPFASRPGVTYARRNGAEVFAVNVGLDNLAGLLARAPVPAGSRLQIADGAGRVVAGGGRPDGAGADVMAATLRMSAGSTARRSVHDETGAGWQVSAAPLRGFGEQHWTLAVATPDASLFAEAERQRSHAIRVTVLAMLFSVPLAWGLSRLLTTPLHDLADVARGLSALQFQARPDTRSVILEVDQLARAIGVMRGAIARFLEMGRDLGAARDVGAVLDDVVNAARDVAGARLCRVEVADDGEGCAEVSRRATGQPLPAGPALQVLSALVYEAEGPVSLADRRTSGPWQYLGIPLRTPDGEALGALLLADRQGPRSGLARAEVAGFLLALAGSAAVALENQRLLRGRKALLRGVISMVAEAIDAKSPYTGGHCRRVTALAQGLARAAEASSQPSLAQFRLDANGHEALEIACWLHDCGKLTTPEYVIDKGSKLETLYNRIHEIRTRFEVLKRDVEVAYWRGIASGGDAYALRRRRDAAWQSLDDDFAFVARCNRGAEGVSEADLTRIDRIAARRWVRTLDDRLGLSPEELARHHAPPPPLPVAEALLHDGPEQVIARTDSALFARGNPWGFTMTVPSRLYDRGEVHNLKVGRGTLTEEERFKIREHIVQTILMLSRLPFPRELAAVPEMAGGHHETPDGRGYPRGLRGDQMSVAARILAIADIYEALTAPDRPYRSANTPAEALEIMTRLADEQAIDEALFRVFVEAQVWQVDDRPVAPASGLSAIGQQAGQHDKQDECDPQCPADPS